MSSKKSIVAIALSVVGIVLTSSIAVAMNLGVFSATQSDDSPATMSTETDSGAAQAGDQATTPDAGSGVDVQYETVYVDDPPAEEPSPSSAGTVDSAPRSDTPATSVASAPSTDTTYEHDDYEEHEYEQPEYEHEDHEDDY